MKTVLLLLKLSFLAFPLLISCEKKKEQSEEGNLEELIFNPVVGESWKFEGTITLDPSARNLEGLLAEGNEGSSNTYQKERRYLGLKPLEDGSEKMAHNFEIRENNKVKSLEFGIVNQQGIMTLGGQEAGKERLLLAEPILLIPADDVPGSIWSISVPNPNDLDGDPMFARQFRYFGTEQIEILGQVRKAYRVKSFGRTGDLKLQRDFWFVSNLGFVKERKAYYAQKKRLALIEEILVAHDVPK